MSNQIYLAINGDEVKFASYEKSDVDEYIDVMNYRAIQEASDEYGYDLESENGYEDAQYQAGYDGGLYEDAVVNSDALDEDDEITVNYDSGEIEISSDELSELLEISIDDVLRPGEDDQDDEGDDY